MKHLNSAFTIIQTLTYLALLMILCTVLAVTFRGLQSYATLLTQQSEQLLQRNAAYDIMRRDMQAASRDERDQKSEDPNVFVQYVVDRAGKKIDRRHVGYACKKGTLWRYYGTYDFAKKRWVRRKKTVVCKGIQNIEEIWPTVTRQHS